MVKKVEIFAGVTKEGHLTAVPMGMLQQAISSHASKDIRITVERKRKKRSLNQNSFMHGPFFEAMGEMFVEYGVIDEEDAELTKALFKEQFGVKKAVTLPDGTQQMVPISTKDYTTRECEEAMERARRRYAGYWMLPYPNEELNNSLGKKI